MRWEAGEGRRYADWCSGVALNQQEKHKKAGAIKGRRRELAMVGKSVETKLSSMPFVFKNNSKDVS